MNRSHRTHALLATAAAATAATLAALPASSARAQVIVDGSVTAGEYGPALATQNTPTGFGNNLSELNQAFANYTPGGSLALGVTGNLESNNGIVIFVDSKAGGGIANSVPGGFGQFGSFGGAKTDDWGTDTDGSVDVSTPTVGGGSIVGPNFNPDYALEITHGGGTYSINVIDLTIPNEPNDNRDLFLGSGTLDSGAATPSTYLRDGGFTPAGTVSHAFNNTNTAGVNGFNFDAPPGDLGDPASATTGLEFLFDSTFLARTPGHALRVLPFVTNGGGDYLSNQFLPGVNGDSNLEQANVGAGGAPLFDSRFYGEQFYVPIFVPTSDATGGSWATATWTGGAAPNGAEHAARLIGTTATNVNTGGGSTTLGYLELANPGGFTFSGGPFHFDGGNGAAAVFVSTGSHTLTAVTNVPTDTRISVAQDAALTMSTVSLGANKSITKAGPGSLTIAGGLNGAGSALAVDAGTVTLNGDFGASAPLAGRPDLFASTPGGGAGATVILNATQNLDAVAANPAGTIQLTIGGNKAITANTISATGTGKIDLGDGDLVVRDSPIGTWNGTAYTDVAGLIDAGRGETSDAAWDGSGIVTTDPRAIGTGNHTTIGIATGAQVKDTETAIWNGQTIAATDTLVMFTYGGDANLDGKINIDDYGRIDSNVGTPGASGWFNGDFNYDGRINIDDYGIIDSNISQQDFGSLASPEAGAASASQGVAAVPEPGAVSILAAGAGALIGRRRSRRLGH